MSWDACTMEPNTWLRWMECHPGTLSMVQGCGTFLAILVAVLVPVVMRHREETFESRNYRRRIATIVGGMAATVAKIDGIVRSAEARDQSEQQNLHDAFSKLILQRDKFGEMQSDNLLLPHQEMAMLELRKAIEASCAALNSQIACSACGTKDGILNVTREMSRHIRAILFMVLGPIGRIAIAQREISSKVGCG